jgi:hypothetical protein
MENAKGDYVTPDAFVSTDSTISKAVDDLCRDALEIAYYDWWGDNHHALSLGAPGDVLDLRLRLNAAFANSLHSSLVKPKAA